MKHFHPVPLLVLLNAPAWAASTTALFDGGVNSTFTLQTFGDPGGASVVATGGNPGGFLQLTPNVNGQNNWAVFDRTQVGTVPQITFGFQFRFTNLGAGGADGFSFALLPTSTQGTTGGVGTPLFTPEDPALAGTLGLGFDTWGNGAPNDANANNDNYSEISLFFNGGLVFRVDDTRALATGAFNLKDGAWHSVNGTVNFTGSSLTMSVDGTTLMNNVAVPGLAAYESRVAFAGRTGGANETTSIDNINVAFVPEPTSLGLLGVSSIALLGWRRRRST